MYFSWKIFLLVRKGDISFAAAHSERAEVVVIVVVTIVVVTAKR